jgi:uncharacterized protein (TIGR02246 family)
MKNFTFFVCASIAFCVASCGQTQIPPDTRAADQAAIQATDEQWSAAASKGDLEGTLSFYSDDAVVLPGNGPIAKDKKSIREIWAGMMAPELSVSWKTSNVEVAKSGELGYAYGGYQITTKNGAAGADTGKFLEVFKKQADGKWKCTVDIYNSDLPLPAAPEPKKTDKKKK